MDSTTEDEIEDNVIYTTVTQESHQAGHDGPKTARASNAVIIRFNSYYIKEEEGHQVMVLVEVIRSLTPGPQTVPTMTQMARLKTQKVLGKGIFLIHPRQGSTDRNEGQMVLYKTKQVIVLARLLLEERMPVVCGRMLLEGCLVKSESGEDETNILLQDTEASELKEGRIDVSKTPARPRPAPPTWGSDPTRPVTGFTEVLDHKINAPPQLSWDAPKPVKVVDNTPKSIEFTSDPEPLSVFKVPEVPQKIMVPDAPLGEWREPAWFNSSNYVSLTGTEEVSVIIYGAYNLPLLHDGSKPKPYASLRISGQKLASGTTHASTKPTCNPAWHEALSLTIPEPQAENSVIELAVVDASQEMLVNYHIPLTFLQPFYHHHLNLVTPVQNSTGAVNLYATFLRKKSKLLPNTGHLPSNGLEVVVHGIAEKLKPPTYPMIIVARIVTSFEEYRTLAASGVNSQGVCMEMVTFPSPHASWFQSIPNIKLGHPQVSLIGSPDDQPQWNQPFVFSHPYDVAAISSLGATLVLELYVQNGPKTPDWKIENSSGFAFIVLNKEVQEKLARSSNASAYFPGIPIEGGKLETLGNEQPTLELILINIPPVDTSSGGGTPNREPKVPHSPYVPYHRNSQEICSAEIQLDFSGNERRLRSESMTSIDRWVREYSRDKTPNKSTLNKSIRRVMLPSKDDLPSHDAIENLLPEYQYILPDATGPSKNLDKKRTQNDPPTRPEDVERVSMSLLDYQQQELEKYRHAVHTMGQDVLSLRERIQQLEEYNSQLRRELGHYSDSTRLLLDAQEMDGLSRADIAERYVSLKHNLNRTSAELRDYKDKVLNLQNELIKRNDKEKQYSKLSEAHEGQQDVLRRLQDRATKVRRLEDVIRKQEKVIEKMEKIINSKSKTSNRLTTEADAALNEALLEENKRLRLELEESTSQRPDQEDMDKERLQLYSKLERAESRISSLENQLEENARQWAREKSDLQFQLQETDAIKSSRASPSYDNISKPRPHVQGEPIGQPRRFSRYTRVPSPGRRNKPHIGYNSALYDPLQHS